MKQILQNLKSGETTVADIPCPAPGRGQLLIRTAVSLVSTGTERMLVEFGKASLLDKARQQPDKVRLVVDKVKTDGLMPTLDAVRNKLDQPLPMGYSNVGVIMEVGTGVEGFAVGDRVVSNGKHAEVVAVPKNLCTKVPENVSDEAAAFTVIGAIGLQGIRLVQPTLGESVVVIGLGLIGLVTVQLLKAHGCRVLGIDLDPQKLDLAREFGVETVDVSTGQDPVSAALAFSRGRGVDAVLITASTKSKEPIHQAALMSRKRGRIVLVGVTGLELSRADFYEKELRFQVSCSYGPGRYDPVYEEGGQDYPVGFVRWTEQRNFEAVLDMLADGRLQVDRLISHRFALEEAQQAYQVVVGTERSLGILLRYSRPEEKSEEAVSARTVHLVDSVGELKAVPGRPTLGFIGAGNYATSVLIPAFVATSARLKSICSSGGVSAVHAGKKYSIEESTTDSVAILADPRINTVVVSTRHDTHARFVTAALRAGKHVFVEKPLTLTRDELTEVEQVYREVREQAATRVRQEGRVGSGISGPLLMVGFNRRFAPQVVKMKELLRPMTAPKAFVMTVNAGAIPAEHWTQDRCIGGGRIIGEACHFIDLLRHLAGVPVVTLEGARLDGTGTDNISFTLKFAEGSMGTVHYLANGHKSFPKERLEVFCGGRILQLDNFRSLKAFGWPGFHRMSLWRQDKGQKACAAAFVDAIQQGKAAPISAEEIFEVTRITFDVVDTVEG